MRTRGDGSIHKDKTTGLWVGQIELEPDPLTGKRRKKVVRRKSQVALQQALKDLREQGVGHRSAYMPTTTVAEYMAFWLEHVNASRPKTRAGYRSKIDQYIIPAIGKLKLDKLTTDDVRKVHRYVTVTKKLSPTSAHQTHQILAKALKDAEREGKVKKNVARLVDAPVRAATKSVVLDTEQATEVLRAVSLDRLGSRWATALLTGMRQGEALGLELDRVDLTAGTLDLSWQLQRVNWRHGCGPSAGVDDDDRPIYPCGRIRGTDCHERLLDAPASWEHRHLTGALYLSRPKSDAGWRVIPLVEPLRSIIERRLAVDEPNEFGLVWTAEQKMTRQKVLLPLDGMPVDPSIDNAAWHSALEKAEVPQMRLHDARHTAVTLLYDLGVDESTIQAIVGQSVVAVTRGYRHRNMKPLSDALSQLGSALSIQP